MKPRVLVAGMGNDLRGDDGFGIAAARRFEEAGVPEGVAVYESGIGGIGLVQELMGGYEALVVLDATDRGEEPGTV
ncbi:hydrogenase maturation protease, partial [Klebsiella pneumoniae]|nr:hydrogenase maturation protease [Klebsiella pneumoniae]